MCVRVYIYAYLYVYVSICVICATGPVRLHTVTTNTAPRGAHIRETQQLLLLLPYEHHPTTATITSIWTPVCGDKLFTD